MSAPPDSWSAPSDFWLAPPDFWSAPPDFWSAPPWPPAPKASGYRVGATHLSADHWLPNHISPAERARKLGLLTLKSLPAPVFAELPLSKAAQTTALQQICSRPVAADNQSAAANARQLAGHSPLARAALLVPEDLCLLQFDPAQQKYQLIAGALCSPSYWRLPDKLGATLREIHAPVPGLNAELGDRVDLFMRQLPGDGIFQRENFFLHQQQDFYQPGADQQTYGLGNIDQWVIRSERQQFRRLENDLLLFSIRVRIFPWRQIRQYPQAQRSLRRHLASFNSEQIQNFGGQPKWQCLCDLLDAWQSSD